MLLGARQVGKTFILKQFGRLHYENTVYINCENNAETFPVGKVNMLHMYPMSYEEFLIAKDLRVLYDVLVSQQWDMVKALKNQYIEALREYYFTGGMPEAVKEFVQKRNVQSVRRIQKDILAAYTMDISKHAPKESVIRISQVWNSIPSQLAKENKKFIYGAVKKGARAREYESAIQWLIDAGLVCKVNRITKPAVPLKNYEDISAFKLFVFDAGLLGR